MLEPPSHSPYAPGNHPDTTVAEHLFDLARTAEPTIPIHHLQPEFPQLQILHPLGPPAMGLVYLARQLALERQVILKLLPAAREEDPTYLARFRAEAIALAKIQHPGVVTIFDHGTTAAGRPWILMEHIQGDTLATCIAQQNIPSIPHRTPLDHPTAITIALHLCDALDAVHTAGLIHRDIKPTNILITPDGKARLIDFGIATHALPPDIPPPAADAGKAIGTPGYMAPEQTTGSPTDHRADIYALGIVLRELAYVATTAHAEDGTQEHHRQRLSHIAQRATATHPADRHQTIPELAADLRALRADFEKPNNPANTPHPRSKNTTHPIAIPTAIAATLTLAALLLDRKTTLDPTPDKTPTLQPKTARRDYIISPDGLAYTNISASTIAASRLRPEGLFDAHPTPGKEIDTTGKDETTPPTDTDTPPDRTYAGDGPGPHYVAFSISEPHHIHTLYYAQRDFLNRHDPHHDKAAAIDLWASTTTPFAPTDPHTPPATTIPITHRLDDTFTPYPLPQPITGTHFLIRIHPDLHPTGPLPESAKGATNTNPGGAELRLGGEPTTLF